MTPILRSVTTAQETGRDPLVQHPSETICWQSLAAVSSQQSLCLLHFDKCQNFKPVKSRGEKYQRTDKVNYTQGETVHRAPKDFQKAANYGGQTVWYSNKRAVLLVSSEQVDSSRHPAGKQTFLSCLQPALHQLLRCDSSGFTTLNIWNHTEADNLPADGLSNWKKLTALQVHL